MIPGIIASGANVSDTAFESIASVVRSGGYDEYTFTNIPQTYKHLQLRVLVKGNAGSGLSVLYMRVNGSSASSYGVGSLASSAGSLAANASVGVNTISFSLSGDMYPADSPADIFGAGIFDIYDYASTSKTTTVRGFSGTETNDTTTKGALSIDSGVFNSTDAVTSLKIYFGINFANETTLSLYGIRGA